MSSGTGSAVRRTGTGLLWSLGLIVVLVAIWQLVTTLFPSPFFPPPSAIIVNAGELFFDDDPATFFLAPALTVDAASTTWRMLAGFALGSVFGIIVGSIIGLSRVARELSSPIVEFLRSIPATASLPLFIILLGGDDAMRVAFIAWGASWFVVVNTAAGVSSIHPTLLSVGTVFRLSPVARFARIVLPAALPKIFAGLRIALTSALLLAVVSEFFLASNGIGFALIQAQRRFQLLEMWSWMLLLAVLGLLLNTLLEAVERRTLSWYRLSKRHG